MSNATMTAATLTTIARSAGIDLNAHGAKAAFARTLGVRVQQVSAALSSGKPSKTVAAAALIPYQRSRACQKRLTVLR